MKSVIADNTVTSAVSHPARGAWIEIISARPCSLYICGRTPQGVRGLKFKYAVSINLPHKVAPRKGCVD